MSASFMRKLAFNRHNTVLTRVSRINGTRMLPAPAFSTALEMGLGTSPSMAYYGVMVVSSLWPYGPNNVALWKWWHSYTSSTCMRMWGGSIKSRHLTRRLKSRKKILYLGALCHGCHTDFWARKACRRGCASRILPTWPIIIQRGHLL